MENFTLRTHSATKIHICTVYQTTSIITYDIMLLSNYLDFIFSNICVQSHNTWTNLKMLVSADKQSFKQCLFSELIKLN